MVKYLFSISLNLLLFFLSSGQQSQPILTTFTSADGLSVNNVNNVYSGSGGFLWVATNNGLNKFDGNHFTRFYSSFGRDLNGMTGNVVKQVICDSLFTWAAIENGGVNCYYDAIDYFNNYVHDPADPNSLISNSVNCMMIAKNKQVYIGTDSGLSLFKREINSFINFSEHPEDKTKLHITALEESAGGDIFIGTSNQGLLSLNKKTGLLLVVGVPVAIRLSVINDLKYDPQKHLLWLATSQGLWCANTNDETVFQEWRQPYVELSKADVSCIENDGLGNTWIGTSTTGLFKVDVNGVRNHYFFDDTGSRTIVSNRINNIYSAADGTTWLSTSRGLQVYHESLQMFKSLTTNVVRNNNLLPAAPAGMCLWHDYLIAATDKAVAIIDTNFLKSGRMIQAGKKKSLAFFTNVRVISNKIFITGSDGVYELLFNHDQPQLIRPVVLKGFQKFIEKACKDIVMASDSIYWLSGRNKTVYILNIISGKADSLVFEDTDQNVTPVCSYDIRMVKDKEGRMLIGTNHNMGVYSSSGKPVNIKPNTKYLQGLPNLFYITDFYDDGKNIWVATSGCGVFRCNRSLEISNQYTIKEGLCDNTVYCIQPDDAGKLWLTTSRGLSVFEPASGNFSNFYQQHGLLSEEFVLYGKSSLNNHTLYFATREGVVKVSPYKLAIQRSTPLRPTITKLMIDKDLVGNSELALINKRLAVSTDYGKNIALSFAEFSFLNSYDYTMQYRLDDNESWLDMLSGTELILSQLSAGNHELNIRGIVKAEHRIGESLVLSLFIKAAYYQEWWFILLFFMGTLLIIYGIYKYRINQLKKVFIIRTNISRDLHDSVGAGLSSISIFSYAAIQKLYAENLTDSKNILERISETSSDLMSELNDTVWLINPKNDNLKNIIQRINSQFLPLCGLKDVHFEIIANLPAENIELSVEKRKAVYLILKEAINNSLKYASAKNLVITITKNRRHLHISVKDDGCGFSLTKADKGNGLTNMKSRVENIGGEINIYSVPENGTEVQLSIPLPNIGLENIFLNKDNLLITRF